MIVELIGSSGAGKTSLAKAIRESVTAPGRAVMEMDLVTDHLGVRRIRNPHAINLAADLGTLPHFLGAFGRHREYLRFAFDWLRRNAPTTFSKLNYMRNVVRKVGMYELARRQPPATTVLVDEGTVLTAYQLFVYSRAPIQQAALDRFAALVPMPDHIIHVKASVEVLVERAVGRHDPRRELSGRTPEELTRWLERANLMFEGLVATPQVAERLLVVDRPDSSFGAQDAALSEILEFIGRADPPARPGDLTRTPDRSGP